MIVDGYVILVMSFYIPHYLPYNYLIMLTMITYKQKESILIMCTN
jgi:hypothetical protein